MLNNDEKTVKFIKFDIMIRREKQNDLKENKTTVFWDTILKEKIKPEDSNSVENYVEKTIIKETPENKEIKKEDRPV